MLGGKPPGSERRTTEPGRRRAGLFQRRSSSRAVPPQLGVCAGTGADRRHAATAGDMDDGAARGKRDAGRGVECRQVSGDQVGAC